MAGPRAAQLPWLSRDQLGSRGSPGRISVGSAVDYRVVSGWPLAKAMSTAQKYRNRPGSVRIRAHVQGRWPAGMDAGGCAACCLQAGGQGFESP